MAQHALRSPSSAKKWMTCPGSLALEEGLDDPSSDYADEGTAAHFLASETLQRKLDVAEFAGHKILVGCHQESDWDGAVWDVENLDPCFEPRNTYEVDGDMVRFVGQYVFAIRERAKGGTLFVEQRLPIGAHTLEEDAHGTSDAVIITADNWLEIHDLKYGRGEIVEAEENWQLMIYALGAYDEFNDIAGPFAGVRLGIHQPRVSGTPSIWEITVPKLLAFAAEVKKASQSCVIAWNFRANWIGKSDAWLHPSEEACRWCRAKADCPALAKSVAETIGAEFEDLDKKDAKLPAPSTWDAPTLSQKLAACDTIEKWIKAVRSRADTDLRAGVEVPGYKLVAGKKGPRKWKNVEEAEKMLREFRIKHEYMYDYSVVSPTTAEKLAADNIIGPRQWPKLQELITQADGALTVVPESDKRPGVVMNVAQEFDDLSAEDMA